MSSGLTQQGRSVPLFSRTPGLNIVAPGEQLQDDPEKSPLSMAYNVDLTSVGGVCRRYGYTLLSELTEPHSLWADGEACFVVAQAVLYKVNKDLTIQSVRDDITTGLPMYYAKVGRRVYYENGLDCGLWPDGEWDLRIPTGAPPDAVYSFPTLGKYLTAYNGRLYCAVDDFLHFTEYMNLHATRLNRNVAQMPTRINFIAASEDVLWVGTEESIVALTGGGPADFKFSTVCDYPAMDDTVAKVPAARYKPGTWWFCNTSHGMCALGPNGAFENMTQNTVAVPGTAGCGAVFPSGKYVVTFD